MCSSRVAGESESSFIHDFETLTSEFALESLECVYSFLESWEISIFHGLQPCLHYFGLDYGTTKGVISLQR
jgi:hypothetical protein